MLEEGDYAQMWKHERLARFTSSNIWKLMIGEKKFGDQGMGYIRSRVFEKLSGVSSEQEFSNYSTIHGLVEEIHGLRLFVKEQQILEKMFHVQKLIYGEEIAYSTTPDGVWLKSYVPEKDAYNASTVEIKCLQAEKHIQMMECDSPADVKAAEKKFYYQVLDQMIVSGCPDGYLVFFHPSITGKGGYKSIQFKQSDLWEEVKEVKAKKKLALIEFDRIFQKLTQQ